MKRALVTIVATLAAASARPEAPARPTCHERFA